MLLERFSLVLSHSDSVSVRQKFQTQFTKRVVASNIDPQGLQVYIIFLVAIKMWWCRYIYIYILGGV